MNSELLTLSTDNLVKIYGRKKVVDNVSLEVKQGEIVGLLGPNGAGKTTVFYMVTGLIQPNKGKVLLGNTNITKMPMYKRARMGIGYLPQEASVFRKLTVKQNIKAILEMMPFSRDKIEQRLKELMNDFSISHLSNQKANTLSGGERRRLEIARALVTDPKFILLDEPFA